MLTGETAVQVALVLVRPMTRAAAARLLAFVSAAFVCTHARVDPDLWGHVRFGLDTLRDRRLASIDPYSFTQDIPWVNHEWLSEVAQAVAYRAAGVFGLIALKTILLGAAVALLALGIRRAVEPYRWLLLAAGIVSLAPAAYTMRPQLWTLLGIPALWWALQERRRLVWIPAIFALWVNLHGGWIVGIGVASLWLAGRFVDGRADHSDRPLRETAADLVPTAAAIAAGVAATLINPYGWRMWMFLLSTVRVTRNITEWRPLWQQESVSFAVLWLLVAAVIVVPTLIRRRRSISWAGALPAAWLGVMSIFVTRLLPIFGEVAVLGLAQAWTVRLKADTIVDGASGEVRLRPDATAARQFLIIDAIVAAVIVLSQRDSAIALSGDRRHVDARSCRRGRFSNPIGRRPAGPALRLGPVRDLALGAAPARLDRRTPRNGVQREHAPGPGSRRGRSTRRHRLPRARAAGICVAPDASKQRAGILARGEWLSARRADGAIGRRHPRRLAAAPRRDTDAAVLSVSHRVSAHALAAPGA